MEANGVAIQPSRRDSAVLLRCPGVELKRRAIFTSPFGTGLSRISERLQNFRETLPLAPPDEFVKVAKLAPFRDNQVAILVNRSAVR